MNEYVAVLTTVDNKMEAEGLAKTLVGERLAACLQIIGPIRSTYWWKGTMETAEEWLCWMKTRTVLYPALEKRLAQLHSYETPQIVALPIVRGSEQYFAWMNEVLAQGRPPAEQEGEPG